MTKLLRGLTGAVVLIVLAGSCTSHAPRPASTSTTANSLPVTTTSTRSATGLTAGQLDAHDGANVAGGWDPVDSGDARVWVPKGWILESEGACIGDPSAAGMISVGGLPQVGCDRSGQYRTPTEAVALIPWSHAETGHPTLTVHGYRIYRVASDTPGWRFYDVPQLSTRIATHGTTGPQILETLAPSARAVALAFMHEAIPKGWHAVTEDGVSLSIPSTWTVATPDFFCASPVSDSTLLLVKPDVGVAPCPAPAPTPAGALRDGVTVYLPPHNRYAPSPAGQPFATLDHATTTIAIYTEEGDPNVLDLFVRRNGSETTHDLSLGLGRNGRVAAGALASIDATR